jgi:hypothetical protein
MMTREERREVRRLLKGTLAAFDELASEFVSKKHAADWGVINTGLYNAEQKVRELKEKR